MLTDGLKLMVVGLSTVFVFLAFMILIINLLAKILLPFAKAMEPVRASVARPKGAVVTGVQQEDKAIVAAIMTAVCRYRAARKKR